MALDRKDFRGKLDASWHDFMRAVADAEGLNDGEWIEQLVLRELKAKVHAASVIADAAQRAGITGNGREKPGTPGN
jgi:hypothetical protein